MWCSPTELRALDVRFVRKSGIFTTDYGSKTALVYLLVYLASAAMVGNGPERSVSKAATAATVSRSAVTR